MGKGGGGGEAGGGITAPSCAKRNGMYALGFIKLIVMSVLKVHCACLLGNRIYCMVHQR